MLRSAVRLPRSRAAAALSSFAQSDLATPSLETKRRASVQRPDSFTTTVKVVEPSPAFPALSVAVAEKV